MFGPTTIVGRRLQRSVGNVSRCYVNFAALSFELGDLETASRVRLEGIAHAQRSGNGQAVRWLRAEIAIDSFAAGDWDEVLGLGETLLARSDGDDVRHYLDAPLRLQRAFVAALRDRRLLVEDVDAALELGRQAGDPQLTWPTLTDASLVMATLGRMVEAASLLDEALAARSASGSAYVINSRWSMVGALVWCLLDRGAVSNVLLAGDQTRWASAAGLVARGDIVAAADLLDRIGTHADAACARVVAARALASEDPQQAAIQLELASAFLPRRRRHGCPRGAR